MQTLIMSEGDKWIHAQTSNVVIALRAGTAGEPVKTADAAVRKFATKELGKAELIASLEDYIANAVIDLLLLAAWTLALETINGDPIPISYFARDDRMYKALVERLEKNEKVIRQQHTGGKSKSLQKNWTKATAFKKINRCPAGQSTHPVVWRITEHTLLFFSNLSLLRKGALLVKDATPVEAHIGQTESEFYHKQG
ncbi:hypothetical protein LENED_009662 [Lentinula edodes]|uniref:Uncharacterized protein n=1 Tax=Lentinula edodes TaxID=5353 RepID=A0A1Q3EKL5_LENED|nr:hypothetical protein LENED_009662 [Lentinula edodes]